MSRYYDFYVECRRPEGWVVPPDFLPEPGINRSCEFGGFAWARTGWGWTLLFFGSDPLFPVRRGPPDDRRGSPLLRYLDRFYDYERNEDGLCWLPYPELFIDCWDTDLVTVGAKAPARYAFLFGDGVQEFPAAALLEAGASEEEVEHLRAGWYPAREPVDAAFGKQRSRLAELPPDRRVEVTWRATIAEFVGERHAGLFKGLRRYGPDEDLRILFMHW